MTVKIVTDTMADIPDNLAQELGITVVPAYVRFGEDVYRDRVEITTEKFYHRLVHDATFPATTQAPPGDFVDVYTKLAKETDEILVVNMSGKLSGTYQSALQAKGMIEEKCRIEVIDSETVIMSLGMIVITVAKAAQAGANLGSLADMARRAIPRSHVVMLFDTLKYLAKGGRIGKAKELMGSLLSVKQILTIKDGEVAPLTRRRSLSAGMDYLYEFVAGFTHIGGLAVEHATTPDELDKLAERLGSLFPAERIYKSTVSPVLGAHGGPGCLSVSVLEAVDD